MLFLDTAEAIEDIKENNQVLEYHRILIDCCIDLLVDLAVGSLIV